MFSFSLNKRPDPTNHPFDCCDRFVFGSQPVPIIKGSANKSKILNRLIPGVEKRAETVPAAGILTDSIIEGILPR
jgi:hypothetical protein